MDQRNTSKDSEKAGLCSSSGRKKVSFKDAVEEFYFDGGHSGSQDICTDEEMAISEMSPVEPLAYDIGNGLQVYTTPSEFEGYYEKGTSIDEYSPELSIDECSPEHNQETIETVDRNDITEDDDDDDESPGKRDKFKSDVTTAFLATAYSSLSTLLNQMNVLHRICKSPLAPVDEDDVVAAVVLTKGGGNVGALGATGGASSPGGAATIPYVDAKQVALACVSCRLSALTFLSSSIPLTALLICISWRCRRRRMQLVRRPPVYKQVPPLVGEWVALVGTPRVRQRLKRQPSCPL